MTAPKKFFHSYPRCIAIGIGMATALTLFILAMGGDQIARSWPLGYFLLCISFSLLVVYIELRGRQINQRNIHGKTEVQKP